jgi:tol-pal system protein YbgF
MTCSRTIPAKVAGFILVFLLTALVGCVPATRESVAQAKRIDQMAEDIQRLKRELHDTKTPAPAAQLDPKIGERMAELGAHVERLDQEVKGIGGKIEEVEYALNNQASAATATKSPSPKVQALSSELKELVLRVDTLTLRLNALGAGSGSARVPSSGTSTQAQTANTQQPISSKELYDKAYKLYRQGKYIESHEAFLDYLRRFPDSALADNAYFWIGEAYYDQGQYEQAILQYDKVVQKFPKGDKVASAILKQAFAFSAIDDNLDARILLKKVINEHPGSEQAGIAKKKLAVIGE